MRRRGQRPAARGPPPDVLAASGEGQPDEGQPALQVTVPEQPRAVPEVTSPPQAPVAAAPEPVLSPGRKGRGPAGKRARSAAPKGAKQPTPTREGRGSLPGLPSGRAETDAFERDMLRLLSFDEVKRRYPRFAKAIKGTPDEPRLAELWRQTLPGDALDQLASLGLFDEVGCVTMMSGEVADSVRKFLMNKAKRWQEDGDISLSKLKEHNRNLSPMTLLLHELLRAVHTLNTQGTAPKPFEKFLHSQLMRAEDGSEGQYKQLCAIYYSILDYKQQQDKRLAAEAAQHDAERRRIEARLAEVSRYAKRNLSTKTQMSKERDAAVQTVLEPLNVIIRSLRRIESLVLTTRLGGDFPEQNARLRDRIRECVDRMEVAALSRKGDWDERKMELLGVRKEGWEAVLDAVRGFDAGQVFEPKLRNQAFKLERFEATLLALLSSGDLSRLPSSKAAASPAAAEEPSTLGALVEAPERHSGHVAAAQRSGAAPEARERTGEGDPPTHGAPAAAMQRRMHSAPAGRASGSGAAALSDRPEHSPGIVLTLPSPHAPPLDAAAAAPPPGPAGGAPAPAPSSPEQPARLHHRRWVPRSARRPVSSRSAPTAAIAAAAATPSAAAALAAAGGPPSPRPLQTRTFQAEAPALVGRDPLCGPRSKGWHSITERVPPPLLLAAPDHPTPHVPRPPAQRPELRLVRSATAERRRLRELATAEDDAAIEQRRLAAAAEVAAVIRDAQQHEQVCSPGEAPAAGAAAVLEPPVQEAHPRALTSPQQILQAAASRGTWDPGCFGSREVSVPYESAGSQR
eukprot:TRINITY_DN5107_c0_g1_i1.p1 TRINITY_DN5107_c0_g1~~TRINITY_DN5107_c0_g1_i1.p1  ORF type:complete len:798 (+),score=240.09 TRINITY_DN5107_c0_g1_i1:70-2463(+)